MLHSCHKLKGSLLEESGSCDKPLTNHLVSTETIFQGYFDTCALADGRTIHRR